MQLSKWNPFKFTLLLTVYIVLAGCAAEGDPSSDEPDGASRDAELRSPPNDRSDDDYDDPCTAELVFDERGALISVPAECSREPDPHAAKEHDGRVQPEAPGEDEGAPVQ
jgi:hypothetical protein